MNVGWLITFIILIIVWGPVAVVMTMIGAMAGDSPSASGLLVLAVMGGIFLVTFSPIFAAGYMAFSSSGSDDSASTPADASA